MSTPGKNRIVFRADGNGKMGLGHVYRLLALAEMLRTDFNCVFAIQNPTDSIKQEIFGVCETLIELPEKETEAAEILPHLNTDDIVVLDGYSFNTGYQAAIKANGNKIVCIDDIYSYHFLADVVINHAVGIVKELYSVEPYTRCFFGPDYLLLRRPFRQKQEQRNKNLNALLLNMGGADPHNDTCRLLESVGDRYGFDRIHIVVGGAFKFTAELNNLVGNFKTEITLYKNLNAVEMAQVMSKSGIAILPPSTVSLEYSTIGGILFLHQIADNQKDIKQFLLDSQLAFDFSVDFEMVMKNRNSDAFDRMLEKQQLVFDGRSEKRLKDIFKTLCTGHA